MLRRDLEYCFFVCLFNFPTGNPLIRESTSNNTKGKNLSSFSQILAINTILDYMGCQHNVANLMLHTTERTYLVALT